MTDGSTVTGSIRGAYIGRLDVAAPHLLGVAKKIEAQVAALRDAVGPVETWFLRAGMVERDGEIVARPDGAPLARQRLYASGFYGEILKRPPDADYIYIRYQRCSPAFLGLLAGLKRQRPDRPIFVEIPTWPYESEQLTPRERLLGVVDRLTRGGMKSHVDAVVTFSAATEILGIPTIRTDNGVGLEALPLSRARVGGEEPVRLVGVANLGLRHAYDRVIDGLAEYRAAGDGRPVVFDIVGSGAEEAALRARVADRGVADIVTFHGPLNGAALDARLALCHVGVSGLGMHRIGADTSDIKSREYCARGLPFVIANTDRDFGPDFPYAFHAPMDETPVDIAGVLGFLDGLGEGYGAAMRGYATANLTWTAKMAPVIAAIRARTGREA